MLAFLDGQPAMTAHPHAPHTSDAQKKSTHLCTAVDVCEPSPQFLLRYPEHVCGSADVDKVPILVLHHLHVAAFKLAAPVSVEGTDLHAANVVDLVLLLQR